MCGLTGVAGTIHAKHDKVFKQLLYVDGLRGMHSTGVLFVPWIESAPPKVLKSALPPSEYLKRPDVTAAITRKNIMMLGHNRYATVGKVVDENAHPFTFSNVIGAHNGTLTNKRSLVDSKDFVVDSENLYHSIDKLGLEDTYEIIQGAWALSWWDVEGGKLNFIRNAQRPLAYTFSEDRKTMFWASESGMLKFILDRGGMKHTDIVETKPHHLYTFEIPTDGKSIHNITVKDMTPEPKVIYSIKKDRASSVNSSEKYHNRYSRQRRDFVLGKLLTNNFNQSYFEGEFLDFPHEKICMFLPPACEYLGDMYGAGEILRGNVTHYKSSTKEYFISPHQVEEVDEPIFTHTGFNGEALSLPQFKERTNYGCAWCGSPVAFEEDLLWLDSRDCMCEECAISSDTKEYRKDLGVN